MCDCSKRVACGWVVVIIGTMRGRIVNDLCGAERDEDVLIDWFFVFAGWV